MGGTCLARDGRHQQGAPSRQIDLHSPVAASPSDQIPMKKLLRITGARIAQLGEPPKVLDDTDLWIADGRILALLPAGTSAPTEGQVETLAFQKALVMPGLIN